MEDHKKKILFVLISLFILFSLATLSLITFNKYTSQLSWEQYTRNLFHQLKLVFIPPHIAPVIISYKDQKMRPPIISPERDSSILLVGDSFTFDYNAKEGDETLHQIFFKKSKYNIISIAFVGASTGHFLYTLSKAGYYDSLKKYKIKKVFLNLISPMLERSLGKSDRLFGVSNQAKYTTDKDKLIFNGSHLNSSTFVTRLNSFFYSLIGPNYTYTQTPKMSVQEIQFQCQIINNFYEKLIVFDKKIDLTVFFYPEEFIYHDIKKCLSSKIIIEDFKDIRRPKDWRATSKDGWHPSQEENEWYVDLIKERGYLN